MGSSGFDQVSVETLSRRLLLVTIFVFVIFSMLVFRLWFLQVINGQKYRTQSENNRIHLQRLSPYRGRILDRNGELLVDNLPSFNLYIIPEDIQDEKKLLNDLKILINLDPEEVEKRLKKESGAYAFQSVLIKKNMSRDELAIIQTHLFNLPGVTTDTKPRRSYLYGDFAAHIIGYLGEISEKELARGQYSENIPGDYIGKVGVEGKWQKELNGTKGEKYVEVDAAGRQLQVVSKKSAVSGQNISLTLDKNLQASAEVILNDKTGAIVAMDPCNGEILAMASSPSFDPNVFITGIDKTEWNRLTSGKDYPLQNRALSGQYPPGSVFKIVMALAGLEEGTITPEEGTLCTGIYTFGNRDYRCWKSGGHGTVNLHRALKESCDVYFYKLGRKLGIEKIAYYARMCGLGEKTEIGFDSEKPGLIPDNEWKLKKYGVSWQPGETISVSIGQSFVLVTPIQAARLISVIFNGGKVYQPKIVKWVGDENNRDYSEPVLLRELKVDKKNLELIKSALTAVVNEQGGTGSSARLMEVNVAGKTGTAQVITLEKEKELEEANESSDRYEDHAWFVGIAPAEDPKIAVAVIIEHGGHGGSAAAPYVKKLIKEYLGVDK
ncbi:MAG: penicillin-binding protein 2 [Deltaproteobacteria bacterium]|nr:penicillin-binding protein 2 [Deltaproteobacteria bacterium]